MTTSARRLLWEYCVEDRQGLWMYGLFVGNDPILSVVDFNDLDVFYEEDEIEALQGGGLDARELAQNTDGVGPWYSWDSFLK